MCGGLRFVFVAVSTALASCGSGSTQKEHLRAPQARRVDVAPELRAAAASASAPAVPPPPPVWLDPAYDETTAPFRARLVRRPLLFGDERNLALNTTSGAYFALVVPVFEEPKRRDTARVRVLCSSARERVALFVARSDLAQVTRRGAVLAARESQLEIAQTDPSVARMVFDAGVSVEAPRDAAAPGVEVHYRSARVQADGFMRTSQLDEVYEWPVNGAEIQKDARIPRDAIFLDAPRGESFGWVVERPDEGFYDIETVGEPVKGHIFVRARVEGGVLSGWIDASKRAVGLAARGEGRGYTVGVRAESRRRVRLPKGALLSLSDEPIGVVKVDGFYACLGACNGARPLVSVPACDDSVDLVAQLPEEAM